jgi:hypothetical protein
MVTNFEKEFIVAFLKLPCLFYLLTMESFWNLIASFEFSCSYPYGNNHKTLWSFVTKPWKNHCSTTYFLHILSKFGQELMRNFMNLIPKLSFLTRCKIGGIFLQWMMVPFHLPWICAPSSFITSWVFMWQMFAININMTICYYYMPMLHTRYFHSFRVILQ